MKAATERNVKKMLKNPWVKNTVLTVLPFTYSILGSILASMIYENTINSIFNSAYFWIAIIMLVIDIVAIVYFGRIEHRIKNDIDNADVLRNELKLAQAAIRTASHIVRENSHMFHELVYNKHGHSDIIDWRLLYNNGATICSELHTFVSKIALSGSQFSVSIMFRRKENQVNGFTMIARCAPDDMDYVPRSYHSFVSESEARDYFYKTIFDTAPNSSVVLASKEDVAKCFVNIDETKVDYSQFVAVPIACKHNKIVGVLQIAAYEDSMIASDKKTLKKLAEKYFSLYAHLALLCDKYENVQQLLNP